MKTFTLFKRDAAGKQMSPEAEGFRDRPWHFKFVFRGKVYPRCLETNDAGRALAKARLLHKEITQAVQSGELERLDGTKLRHVVAPDLQKLLTAYQASPVDASPATRAANCKALLHLLKLIGHEEAASVLRTPFPELLNAATVAKFFGRAASAEVDEDDSTDGQSAKRTANSTWAKVASMCAPRALAYYKTLKLHHECLDQFLEAGLLHRFNRLPRIEYNPPADAILAKTLAAWQELEDRNLFLTIGHELAFGLRIGEVAQARWSWWTVRQGYPVLDGEAKVKNKTGLVQVRALDPFYTILRAKATSRNWLPTDKNKLDELIIEGSDAFRTDAIFRAASDFLRGLGWETRKTNHALRAYAGSQVAMKYGIYDAQVWLRHSSVKVTEQHYSHFVRKFKPANLEDLPARWATVNQAPILSIVELTA